MVEIKKVIRNGKVGVLYSPGYGAGWFTWNTDVQQCIFSPEIIDMVENNKRSEIDNELCQNIFGVEYFFAGGASQLRTAWFDQGTQFVINEYDGNESIETDDTRKLIA